MRLEVVYFAWLRERIGLPREQIDTTAETVDQLISDLAARDDWHAQAFADRSVIRCAVDQELADADTPLSGAREVAFFPPMTGG